MQTERTKRHPPVECTCVLCGARFTAAYHRVAKGGARYCSYTCAYSGHSLSIAPLSERFWSLVDKTNTCWLWQHWQDKDGYGLFYRALRDRGSSAGRIVRAPRVAWELATGTPPPQNRLIMHTCDTPSCVRNDECGWYEVDGLMLPRHGHLVLGTERSNSHDMIAKGRGVWTGPRTHPKGSGSAKGEGNANAKLTDQKVLSILERAQAGETHTALAAEFDVRQSTISRIVRREAWKHVHLP
jgi:hypothetical protein